VEERTVIIRRFLRVFGVELERDFKKRNWNEFDLNRSKKCGKKDFLKRKQTTRNRTKSSFLERKRELYSVVEFVELVNGVSSKKMNCTKFDLNG